MRKAVFGPSGRIDDMKVVSVPELKAGPGQAVISVRAAGVNFGDTIFVKMTQPGATRPDLTPGYEVAGVVKELGPGAHHCKVGDHVAAFPGMNAYAEEVVVCTDCVYALPADMDFSIGAGLIATYGTSYHAFRDRAQLRPDETVLILGASGGAGLTAVEVARLMGARVIACASTPQKLELCKKYGAHDVINYSAEDLRSRVADLTGGTGVDVAYDPVGGSFVEPVIKSLKPLGRYLIIGFASGDPSQIHGGLLLVRQVAAMGIFWGDYIKAFPAESRAVMQQVVDWCATGKIRPLITAKFPLEQAHLAMEQLVERKVLGKIVLTIS